MPGPGPGSVAAGRGDAIVELPVADSAAGGAVAGTGSGFVMVRNISRTLVSCNGFRYAISNASGQMSDVVQGRS